MESRKRLAGLLEKRRWSYSDLAKRLGEHPHWVRDRVTGRIQIKADELPRIAKALGVSPCAFFEEERSEPRAARPRPHILEAVEREMMRSLDELPEPERDFVEGVGQLLIEYRSRLLGEERGEGAG